MLFQKLSPKVNVIMNFKLTDFEATVQLVSHDAPGTLPSPNTLVKFLIIITAYGIICEEAYTFQLLLDDQFIFKNNLS